MNDFDLRQDSFPFRQDNHPYYGHPYGDTLFFFMSVYHGWDTNNYTPGIAMIAMLAGERLPNDIKLPALSETALNKFTYLEYGWKLTSNTAFSKLLLRFLDAIVLEAMLPHEYSRYPIADLELPALDYHEFRMFEQGFAGPSYRTHNLRRRMGLTKCYKFITKKGINNIKEAYKEPYGPWC